MCRFHISALREEDDLHLDIRSLTMRFLAPKFLVQKKPASLKNCEQSLGEPGVEADPEKVAEIEFWKQFSVQGITDEQVSSSVAKFRAVYEQLEKQLRQSPYLYGEVITLLDIAWFIYTVRLSAVGYPFSSLHPAVHGWYLGLLQRPEFAKEVRTPLPLRLVTASPNLVHKVRGRRYSTIFEPAVWRTMCRTIYWVIPNRSGIGAPDFRNPPMPGLIMCWMRFKIAATPCCVCLYWAAGCIGLFSKCIHDIWIKSKFDGTPYRQAKLYSFIIKNSEPTVTKISSTTIVELNRVAPRRNELI